MIKIYGNMWQIPSAGQYYRISVPLRAMEKLGLAAMFLDDPYQDQVRRQDQIFHSDIQIQFMVAGKPLHAQCQAIADMKPGKNALGEVQHPPLVVYDTDDDLKTLSPLNPKFATLGTRDADGDLLMPRSEMGIKFEDEHSNNEPLYLWRHNQDTAAGRFAAERNVVGHAHVRKMASTAHAITVTCPQLAERMKEFGKPVYVYPNSLFFDDNKNFDIRRGGDDIRVLWQGGYSHFPDFYPLRQAFHEAHLSMPQIKWVVFGTLFRWVYEQINPFRVEFHKWVGHELFHMKYGSLAFDINIAPLADNDFNRCKSGIKWYEAAALKVPTLAQASGPYKDEIVDGENGLLFSTPQEFVEKLECLVKDEDYRKKLGERAYDWVREYRDAEKNVVGLHEFYSGLLKSHRGSVAA